MGSDVQALFDEVMSQSPADRLRLAAMLLDTDQTKAGMALSIAKSACTSIEAEMLRERLGIQKKQPHPGSAYDLPAFARARQRAERGEKP